MWMTWDPIEEEMAEYDTEKQALTGARNIIARIREGLCIGDEWPEQMDEILVLETKYKVAGQSEPNPDYVSDIDDAGNQSRDVLEFYVEKC